MEASFHVARGRRRYGADMGNIGPMEILLVAGLALLLFGPKRLPEIGRSLGNGLREFKDSVSGEHPAEKRSELPPAVPVAQPATATDDDPAAAPATPASA
jgi:sec-independent protein translocase protein TatA